MMTSQPTPERVETFWFAGPERQRLDRFLTQALAGEYSRSRVQQWIREGRVQVAGKTVTKPGFWLEHPVPVEVRIPPPRAATVEPEPIPLDVLFENEDVLVINKPAGM
ncbi:MAG: RNA pseudouridine synthase, partial [Chloroflexi bacterium]|nr:RNA pseudouridine synthase [Chloroflexota bacterium]